MRLSFPSLTESLAVGMKVSPSRAWLNWLRSVHTALGQDTSVPLYGDLWVDGYAMGASSAGDAALVGSLKVARFSSGSNAHRYCVVRLPITYRPGTPLQLYAEWAAADGTGGDVLFEAEYGAASKGSFFSSATDEQKTSAAPAIAEHVSRVSFTSVPGTGLSKGSLIAIRLSRLGADAADTYAADALMLGVGLKYQREALGWEVAHP